MLIMAGHERETRRLRDYQIRAVESILEWKSPRQLLVMATGTGKTVVICEVIRRMLADPQHAGKRVMVVAHTDELIDQLVIRLEEWLGFPVDVEKASRYADPPAYGGSRVVVSSVQTQRAPSRRHGRRMRRFRPEDFCLLVVDEAHHAASGTYREIIGWYAGSGDGPCRVLGVTATPDRRDGKMIHRVVGPTVMTYDIADAMRDGWLVPIQYVPVRVHGLDLSQVQVSAGDLSRRQLSELLSEEDTLHELASPLIELSGDRRTIVFCASRDQAEGLAMLLCRHRRDCAVVVDYRTPDALRAGLIRRFRIGDAQYLCNVQIATEGFDVPETEIVAMARPTLSRPLYCQMVGRGLRPSPDVLTEIEQHGVDGAGQYWLPLWTDGDRPVSDADARRAMIARSRKPHLTLIDYVGNAGRHRLACPSDLFGTHADFEPEDLYEVYRDHAERAGRDKTGIPVPLTIEEAERRAAERRSRLRLAENWREKVGILKAKYTYSISQLDPLTGGNGAQAYQQRAVVRHYEHAPTAKQISLLSRFGIDCSQLTRRSASRLIGLIVQRKIHMLPPSMAQIARLERLDPQTPWRSMQYRMTREQAGRKIRDLESGIRSAV